jgi:organic hydroperoxide reductase OsmC/OhrA
LELERQDVMSDDLFAVELTERDRFQFDVAFGDAERTTLLVDEPEPLGDGAGPNASRLLAAAVGNCLAASLLFCLQKAHVPVAGIRARVEGSMDRNEKGRLRIGPLSVTLFPTVEGEPSPRMERCLDIFEDFCVVTQSVRDGLDVSVDVRATQMEPAGG